MVIGSCGIETAIYVARCDETGSCGSPKENDCGSLKARCLCLDQCHFNVERRTKLSQELPGKPSSLFVPQTRWAVSRSPVHGRNLYDIDQREA